MIVLDALLRGEMIVDERRPDTGDLVGANRRANTAAADRHAALHLSSNDGLCERHDEVGIVVFGIQRVCAEIHDFVAGGPQTREELFLQTEAAVIGSDAHTHVRSFMTRPSLRGSLSLTID